MTRVTFFKSIAAKVKAVVKDTATNAIQNTSTLVKDTATKAVQETSSFVSKKAESAYTKGKLEVSSSLERGGQVASAAAREASTRLTASAQDVATGAHTALHDAAGEAKKEATKGLRWLGCWGILAIAVYGVATTVPRELVRYYLQGTTGKEGGEPQQHLIVAAANDDETTTGTTKTTEGDGDSSRRWSSWWSGNGK